MNLEIINNSPAVSFRFDYICRTHWNLQESELITHVLWFRLNESKIKSALYQVSLEADFLLFLN